MQDTDLTPISAFTEALTPWLPLIGIIAGGIIVGAFGVHNRRRGAVEHRAPDVTQMWSETERARTLRQYFEDRFHEVRGAFRGYVRRVHTGGSIQLTEAEQKAHDLEPNPPKEKP